MLSKFKRGIKNRARTFCNDMVAGCSEVGHHSIEFLSQKKKKRDSLQKLNNHDSSHALVEAGLAKPEWLVEAEAAEMFAREERCRGLSRWLFEKLRVDRYGKPTRLSYDWLDPEFGTRSDLEEHTDGVIFDPQEGHKLFSAYLNHKRYHTVGRVYFQKVSRQKAGRFRSPAFLHERKLLNFLHDMDVNMDGFAALAVADFIIDPLHMLNTYLTLAGRLKALSEEQRQKFDVQERALKFGEICCVAAASCLETLDTLSSQGADVERTEHVAGGSLSAMVLRAEELDTTQPPTLQPIKIAIDKSLGSFLSQPIVYLFLSQEWSGYDHFDRHSDWRGWRFLRTLLDGFVVAIPLAPIWIVLMLWTTIFPGHLGELRACLRTSKLDLMYYFGGFMIPSFKFWSSELSSSLFTFLLTFYRLNPHCDGTALPAADPRCTEASLSQSPPALFILIIWSASFIFAELKQFWLTFYLPEYNEQVAQLREDQRALHRASSESSKRSEKAKKVNKVRRKREKKKITWETALSDVREAHKVKFRVQPRELAHASSTSEAQRRLVAVRRLQHSARQYLAARNELREREDMEQRVKQEERTMLKAHKAVNSRMRWIEAFVSAVITGGVSYWQDSWLEATAHVLALLALISATFWPSSESYGNRVLSVAVLAQWMRLDRLFVPFAEKGGLASFYIMVRRMFVDVFKWCIVFIVFLFAFASAQYVLYRNLDSGLGPAWPSLHDPCEHLDYEVGHDWWSAVRLMLDTVLTGEAYLQCFWQSSDAFGWGIQLLYVIISIILMLNILIAMMAQTFEMQMADSNNLSALQFAKVVHETSSLPMRTPPINLLQLPLDAIFILVERLQRCCRYNNSLGRRAADGTYERRIGNDCWATGCTRATEWILHVLEPSREYYASKKPFPGLKQYLEGDYLKVERKNETAWPTKQQRTANLATSDGAPPNVATLTDLVDTASQLSSSFSRGSREPVVFTPPDQRTIQGRVDKQVQLSDWQKRATQADEEEAARHEESLLNSSNHRAILEVFLRLSEEDLPKNRSKLTIAYVEQMTNPASGDEGLRRLNNCREFYLRRLRDDIQKKAGADEIKEVAYDISQMKEQIGELMQMVQKLGQPGSQMGGQMGGQTPSSALRRLQSVGGAAKFAVGAKPSPSYLAVMERYGMLPADDTLPPSGLISPGVTANPGAAAAQGATAAAVAVATAPSAGPHPVSSAPPAPSRPVAPPSVRSAPTQDKASRCAATHVTAADQPVVADQTVFLSHMIKSLRDPETAPGAARDLARLCQSDGPGHEQPASAFLRNAPQTMSTHQAVRRAIVLRGGVRPLVELILAGSDLVHTAGTAEDADQAAVVAHAMLTLCLLTMYSENRPEVLAADAINVLVRFVSLSQLGRGGFLAEANLAAGTLANLAMPQQGHGLDQATEQFKAPGIIPTLVQLAASCAEGQAGSEEHSLGQVVLGVLTNLHAIPELKDDVERATKNALGRP